MIVLLAVMVAVLLVGCDSGEGVYKKEAKEMNEACQTHGGVRGSTYRASVIFCKDGTAIGEWWK